jgi:protein-tyrosine-phosphatase
MRYFEEPMAQRSIAVVGAHHPARNLALAHLLSQCIAEHGWGERLMVNSGGVADGVGRAGMAELAALSRAGFDLGHSSCPDLASDPTLLEEADLLVVGSDAEAQIVIQWPESEGKEVFALTDFLEDESSAMDDPGADLVQFISQAAEAVPLLLRALVAMRT